MTRIAVAVLGGFALLSIGVSGQPAAKAMTVMVVAAEVTDVAQVDKDTEKQLVAAIKDAEKARKDLDKALKAQYGNKRDQWPEEAQNRYYDAEEAEALANADWAYRKVRQMGLSDSAEDIRKSLVGDGMAGRKDNVTLVTSRDEAQLIVEVNGRRSANRGTSGGLLALRDDSYWISFLVKAGPQLTPEKFAAVPPTYRFKRFGHTVWRLAMPRTDSPQWRFEAFGNQRWGNAANEASLLVEDFIAKNYDAMNAGTR
jgi:hypothetical protein